ncbi:MAG: zinc-binding domain-containing protein [Sphingomonadales bacterium]|nr:zinc-binding domain-containing protein [Sphingomonadales bacterium]
MAGGLKGTADDVAVRAHEFLKNRLLTLLLQTDANDIYMNEELLSTISSVKLSEMVKPAKLNSKAVMELAIIKGIETLGDLLNNNTRIMLTNQILKKGWARQYERLAEEWTQRDQENDGEIYITSSLKPIIAHKISSKSIRQDMGKKGISEHRLRTSPTDPKQAREYLKALKGVTSTKHKNVALRVWNGDIMSRNRLVHMGLVEDAMCQHCNNNSIETQLHVIKLCPRAQAVWKLVRETQVDKKKIDCLGLPFEDPELNLECTWHLLNSKELDARSIFHRATAYLRALRDFKAMGQGDGKIDLLC